MDDQISRKAAIDDLHGKDPSQIWDTADIEVWVNALPSAQPEPCKDAVSRSRVKLLLARLRDAVDDGYGFNYQSAVDELRDMPSAQPERKNGKWVYAEDEYGTDGYHCNQCGFFVPWDYTHTFINYIEDYHFCPNCGTDMRGEADGD